MALKDLIARVILQLDKSSVERAKAEVQAALVDGTKPEAAVANVEKVEKALDDLSATAKRTADAHPLDEATKPDGAIANVEKVEGAVEDLAAKAKQIAPALDQGTQPAPAVAHIEKIGAEVDQLKTKARQVAPAISEGTKPDAAVANVEKVEGALGEAADKAKGIAPALREGTNPGPPIENVEKVGASVQSLISKLRTAAYAFGLFMVANRVRRFAEDAIGAFVDFDAKMNESLAISGHVSDGMRAQMADAAKKIAIDLNIADSKVAEGYFFLASAGLTTEQSLQALPVAAEFAKAGMFDLAKATEMLTVSQSALGLSSTDSTKNMIEMTRVADVLSKANALTNGSVEQLASSLEHRAAATMRQFNIEVEEGVAVLAAYAKQGTVAELGGEEFMRLITRLTDAYGKHRDVFKQLKIEIYDPKDAKKLLPIADILEQITNKLNPMSLAQRTATLEAMGFELQVQGAIRPLLGMSDTIRGFQTALEGASGATHELANNQMNALGEQAGKLGQKLTQLKQDIGQSLVEGGMEASASVISVDDAVGQLKEMVDVARPTLHDFAGGLTTILTAAALLATGLTVGLMTGLNVVANFLVGTLKTGTAIAAAGVGLLVGAIGQLDHMIAYITSLGGHFDNPLSRFFQSAGDAAEKAATKILNFGKETGQSAVGNFTLEDMRPGDPEEDPQFLETARRAREALKRHHVNAPAPKPPPDKPGVAPLTAEQMKALQERAKQQAEFLRSLTVKIAEEAGSAFQAAIAKVDALEKKAHDTFGKTLPDAVQSGLNKMRIAAVQDEQLRKRQNEFGLLKDVPIVKMTENDKRADDRLKKLREEQSQVARNSHEWGAYQLQIEQLERTRVRSSDAGGVSAQAALRNVTKFIETLKDEQSQLEKNGHQWQAYQKLIDAATDEQTKDQQAVTTEMQDSAERVNTALDEMVAHSLERSQDMQNAFTGVAYGISDAFSSAFASVFQEGATLGRFMILLGRQIGAALLGGIATYAGGKVAENIAQAFENHAKATAAMGEGFLTFNPAAFAAAAMFEAAAVQHVVSAAKWAVLAGAASATAAAVGSSGGGGGGGSGGSKRGSTNAPAGASDIGGNQAQDAAKNGPQVIIYVDGFDPKDPRHQEKLWEGYTEAEQRYGTSITVMPGRGGR